jgi:GNAT superfamily N-acetyltransferase
VLSPDLPTEPPAELDPALVALAEQAEAEFMFAYETGTPAAAQELLGAATARIGGGVVLSMAADVTRYWSKTVGLGIDEPITSALIGQVLDFYRANQDQGAALQIAPSLLPDDWDRICAEHGLRPGSQALKLAAPIEEAQFGRSDLRIAPVGPEHAQDWAELVLNTFGMPMAGLADMLTASLGDPAFHPFAAWDGETLVAAANLYVTGEVGSLNTGATAASHRGRGAQSALIAARIQAAAALGCRWLVAETGKPAAGQSNPSTDNLTRAGLQVLYARQNWLWSA